VRVVVVGAGVVGLSAAHHLLADGHEVLVVDRGAEGEESASYGNAGMVVPSHFVPLAAPGAVAQALRWMPDPESPFRLVPRASLDLLRWGVAFWRASRPARAASASRVLLALARASRAAYAELEHEVGPFGLRGDGLLMLCATSHGLAEETALAARAARLGLDVAVLDASGVADLEPDAGYAVAGAVHYREDAHLDPAALMSRLLESVRSRGGEVRRGAPVERLLTRAGRVVGVSGAGLRELADAVVLAAGVWSSRLARGVGLRLPLEAGTGYSLTVPAPASGPRLPAILTEARVAVTPLEGRLRVGGTMELAGLAADEAAPNARRVRGIVEALRRYLPRLDPAPFEAATPWRGHRPVSPDGLPYLGVPRRLPGLVVATGHAMLGVSLAPVTGRAVAELVAGGTPDLPLEALRPDRYS
jgi:D-amino-acid dehydrogenase